MKVFLLVVLFFLASSINAYALTGLTSITSSFEVPDNAPEGTISSFSVNVNNPPENVYVLVNNDPYIPGTNSVGDIFEIYNIHTGKKFVFDSECNTKKLPPLNIRKLLDSSVYEREGRQILNFNFINKCSNSKTIDTLYIVSKTTDEDMQPFLSTVIDIDYNSNIPSTSPTPSIPSSGENLNVPLLKQGVAPYTDGNPSWETEIFDHANAGQFTCGETMAQCGCATTSIAMVMKYYGIDKLPDGSLLTPGTLNTWLKNNKGYNRNLGVIWPAASALSIKAKSQNPNFQYDALEYDTNTVYNPNKLTTDLNQGIPNILQVNAPGMHFVVAKGKTGNTFDINDPLFNRTSLSSYANQASSVRRYVPSHTDLSYIVYVVDRDVDIVLKDASGAAYGESYLEYSPSQLLVEPNTLTTSAVKVFYFAKPASGNYTVELYSALDPDFQLDEYLISEQGDTKTNSFSGTLNIDAPTSFKLNYDKITIENSRTETVREITFDVLKNDIKKLYKQKQIKNVLFYSALLLQTEVAERAKLINRQPLGNKLAVAALKLMQTELNKQKGKGITVEGYLLLYADITALINTLQNTSEGNNGGPGGS